MLDLKPRAASRFADIVPDAFSLIVQFLDFTMLARLCGCSIQLYSHLNPECAPLVWRSVRPERRGMLLDLVKRAPLADARRFHEVYGEWFCSPAATTTYTSMVSGEPLAMPEWRVIYWDAMRYMCRHADVEKMDWFHSLYADHTMTLASATETIEALVSIAGQKDHYEMIQWILCTYGINLNSGAGNELIVEAMFPKSVRVAHWLMTTHGMSEGAVAMLRRRHLRNRASWWR